MRHGPWLRSHGLTWNQLELICLDLPLVLRGGKVTSRLNEGPQPRLPTTAIASTMFIDARA
jgi:hypothetical protein